MRGPVIDPAPARTRAPEFRFTEDSPQGRRRVLTRAWRWCVLRTIRDARLARARRRPIAPHHLPRLFCRRWRACAAVLGCQEQLLIAALARGRRAVEANIARRADVERDVC
jgi:hypothetical protein